MKNRSLLFIALIVAALAMCLVDCVRAADDSKVTPSDQLQFQQKNAQAQMQELQERMYRLAELTREAEPDDSARLLMAVRKAREQLIIEQMKQSLELLATNDYTRAANEEAEILKKLEELKKLLTTSDIDLQLQLEKLRTLNSAIKKLDAATVEEKRQRDRSGEVAKQPQPMDAKALDPLKQDQQQNRRATESITQTVKNLGGAATAAGAKLGGACQSMSLAEGQFGAAKPGDAQGKQNEAVEAMRAARKQLAEERDKILQELEKQVRRQVVENLTEMLERQKSIRAASETSLGRMKSAEVPRVTLVKIKQLGGAETAIVRIADQTIALIEETHFSVALPPALKRIQQKCAVVAARLDDSKLDEPMIDSQKKIERDLKDLLDTFKQLSASKTTPSSCKGCKGDKNKLLAELKVVRMMQIRVNEDTKTVDAERAESAAAAAAANLNPVLRDKILVVRDAQGEVQAAMQHIHDQLTAPDEPADGSDAP